MRIALQRRFAEDNIDLGIWGAESADLRQFHHLGNIK
jgi:hypothetical protein